MDRYRKRPVVIEAQQWDGESWADWEGHPDFFRSEHGTLTVSTPEGVLTVSVGDYIIRGIKGEFYPCKADIFLATYEPADAPVSPLTTMA